MVLRKVEKQTLHWMSIAFSLTFSWDLASLPAFLRLRSRFCADLAPCRLSVSNQPEQAGFSWGVLQRSDQRRGRTLPPPILREYVDFWGGLTRIERGFWQDAEIVERL